MASGGTGELSLEESLTEPARPASASQNARHHVRVGLARLARGFEAEDGGRVLVGGRLVFAIGHSTPRARSVPALASFSTINGVATPLVTAASGLETSPDCPAAEARPAPSSKRTTVAAM